MQKVTGFIQKSLLGAVVAVLVCSGNAYAATCTTANSSATSNWISVMQQTTSTGSTGTSLCTSYTTKYYKCGTAYYKVQDCNTCGSGSTRTSTNFASGYTNTYYICKASSVSPVLPPVALCDPGVDCGLPPAVYWSSFGTVYQRKTASKCDVSTDCEWVTDGYDYRCAAGYYGSANCTGTTSSTCSGCSRCEPKDGIYGTSAAGSDAKTDCYISSSTSLTNTTGTYKFISNCYYTN